MGINFGKDHIAWAENEIELWKKRNIPDDDDDVGQMHYEWDCESIDVSLNMLKYMFEHMTNGPEARVIMKTLNDLVNCVCLSPINEDDEWISRQSDYHRDHDETVYENKRYRHLYKVVNDETNEVYYYDLARVRIYRNNKPCCGWADDLISIFIQKMFPIKFPYEPGAVYKATIEVEVGVTSSRIIHIKDVVTPLGDTKIIDEYLLAKSIEREIIPVPKINAEKYISKKGIKLT